MKKYTLLSLAALLFTAIPVQAVPSNLQEVTLSTPSGNELGLILPPGAENSHVISLGQAIDPGSGELVEGYAFVHYKNNNSAKPEHAKGGKKGGPGSGSTTNACYSYIANGAAWTSTEPYMINPINNQGLDENVVTSLLDTAVNTWNDQVGGVIFGSRVDFTGDGADTSAPDDKNEILFGSIASPGAIAVTTVWGVFSGPPFARHLTEWDMVFDQSDFDWSVETDGVPGKMDFLNIAVHEVGHAAGMGHPENSCIEETMYAYASDAEIKKRTLNDGDIAGIKNLYQ